MKISINAEFRDHDSAQDNGTNALKNPPEKLYEAPQARKTQNHQSYTHDPGGTYQPSEGGNQNLGYIPTPADLAKSFLYTEAQDEDLDLRASLTDGLNAGQSQMSSSNENEVSDLGVGNSLTLPTFLADFLKGVGDRIKLRIQDVQFDIVLKVDQSTDSSSDDDASKPLEDVTVRLVVDSIHVDGVATSELKVKEPDGGKMSTLNPQATRRIAMSGIEVILITEASLFSDLARSSAPSSPATTHTSGLGKAKKNHSPTAAFGAAVDEDRSLDHPRSTNTHTPREHARTSRNAGSLGEHTENKNYASILEDPLEYESYRTDDGEELLEDYQTILESLNRSDHNGFMDSPQSLTNSQYRSTRAYPSGEQRQPDSFSVGDSASPAEDDAIASHILSLQNDEFSSSIPATRHSGCMMSELSYSASDRFSPASEDLAQSKIFTHEEASMYMSAISQASMGNKDTKNPHPDKWALSESDDDSEIRMSQIRKDSATVYEARTEPLSGLSVSQSGPVVEALTKQADRDHEDLRDQSDRNKEVALGEEADDLPSIDQSSTASPKEENVSLPHLDTSLANLKRSFTIQKRVIAINTINILLPISPRSSETRAMAHTQNLDKRDYPMPGGFENDLDSSSAIIGSVMSEPSRVPASRNGSICSLEIESVQVLVDMGLTRIIIMMSQHIGTLLKTSAPNNNTRATSRSSVGESLNWQVNIRQASWKFYDNVKGTPLLEAQHESTKEDAQWSSGVSEVLLKVIADDIEISDTKTAPSTSKTRISVGKSSFGYSSDSILSFHSDMRMRESTSDALSPLGKDIILTIERSNQVRRIDLRTLPVRVALNLRQLDETFSWVGGFSSMLGLGSSMISTMTVVDAKPKIARPTKSPRGVHFESPKPSGLAKRGPIPVQTKVTARLGGLVVDIEGTESSLRFESTAMKLVTRSEGLGLQVDRLRFSGPYLKSKPSEPTTTAKVTNLRIEYLPTPKESDLARLLELLSPSHEKDARDDDILLDRLICQRKDGAVVRASVEQLDGTVTSVQDLRCFLMLAEDLKKLSTVTKYLPEDDRAGLLILGLVQDLRLAITVNGGFGVASLACRNVEGAHVTFPSLTTLSIKSLKLLRNETEELLGEALPFRDDRNSQLPTVMARFVGNEMEPTAKIKLHALRIEYHVSTIMAVMGLEESNVTDSIISEMVSSVATLTDRRARKEVSPHFTKQNSVSSDGSASSSKMLRLDVSLKNSIIGLNPRKSAARGLIVLTDTSIVGAMPTDKDANAILDIRKASIMVVDDMANVIPAIEKMGTHQSLSLPGNMVESLSHIGYVSVGTISSAKATIQIVGLATDSEKAIDIEIKDDLFVLETCADSTQTLQCVMNGLSPPMPPSTEPRYRTEVVPIENMLASFTGNVFATTRSSAELDTPPLELDEGDLMDDEVPHNLEYVSSFYNPEPDSVYDGIANSMLDDDLDALASPSMVREIGDKNLLESFEDQAQVAPGNEPLDFREGHFGGSSTVGGTAHRWDTNQNTYGLNGDKKLQRSPLRIRVRDVHFIWNLFDGYDWQHTRDVISDAVEAVQVQATERLSRKDKRKSLDPEAEAESVIGDFLFNSIYIGIPANRDPRELTRQVNRNLDDLVSEPESTTISTASSSPSRQTHIPRPKSKKLRLKRSQYHKMTFELKGISADVVVFPPKSGETQSSIDVRVQDLEIFDHVPTSTWKKFATYMHDAGERESGTDMIHLEFLNVKPVPDLAASEIIMKVGFRVFFFDKIDLLAGHHTASSASCRPGCS